MMIKRKKYLVCGVLLWLLLLVGGPVLVAQAHPADMFSHVQRVGLSPRGLEVAWEILVGPILAPGVWSMADVDGDDVVSEPEAVAYVGQQLAYFTATYQDKALVWQVEGVSWPQSLESWQLGQEQVEVRLSATWPDGGSEPRTLILSNQFQAESSLNWFYVNGVEGVRFQPPEQQKGELRLEVALSEGAAALADEVIWLESWESGRPTLPAVEQVGDALASKLGLLGSNDGEAQEGGILGMLTELVRSSESSPNFYLLALSIALVVGALHALTPGHGKAIAAAYLVGTRGTIKHAITLGAVVTLTHTGSVFILGIITLVASQYILPTTLFPILEVTSGVLILALGVWLLYQRWQSWRHDKPHHDHHGPTPTPTGGRSAVRLFRFGHEHDHQPHAHHEHDHQHHEHDHQHHEHDHDHHHQQHDHHHKHDHHEEEHDHDAHAHHQHEHHDHDHEHEHHEGHDHHHAHAPHEHPDDPSVEVIYHSHGSGVGHYHVIPKADEGVSWWSLLMLGISGGLVPCPEAIAILLIAVAINRIVLGLSLIISFSFGLALVLIVIGIIMVRSRSLLERMSYFERIEKLAPLVSAFVVLFLGVAVTVEAASGFTESDSRLLGTPEMRSTSDFQLESATILYMSTDERSRFHLFALPLGTREAVQLENTPAGIFSYALSSDGQQIVYVANGQNARTEMWRIAADGSNPDLLFVCTDVFCNNPLWSPDGERLIYERTKSEGKGPQLPTLWWFDLATQSTQPVLADENLPSYAASWSPNGQWLSYLSASTNTLQVFHLGDGRVHSIPNQAGMGATWHPSSEKLLTYDTRQQSGHLASYLLRVDLAQEQKEVIDLSGDAPVEDKDAAWSPDGNWLAVMRRDLSGSNPSTSSGHRKGNQIWLMRPDGSQARALTSDPNRDRRAPAWSPDSRYLLFQQQNLEKPYTLPEIWLLDTQNGQLEMLLERGNQAKWRP